MKKGVFLALLLMLLAAFPALAEDVYYADASQGGSVTSDKGYLSVSCPLDTDSRVTMTIRDEWGSTVYQRDYGVCSGMFASEEVYLPQNGAQTTYRVTLSTDSGENSFTVVRVAPRLTDSNVTTAGLPLSDISGVSSPKKAILLDLSALNNQLPMVVPMVSGDVQLGCVTFTVRNGQLSVSAELTVDGTIDRAAVYVAKSALSAQTLGTRRFDGKKGGLNKKVNVDGLGYAAVLVQMTVSYDQDTATPLMPDEDFVQEQTELWDAMQEETVNEAVG